ncbi:MAG: 16S rRNA (cytidine(1402)-2'-O)-methyltransferase [Candidatus Buchananbacteria bacterium]|nr:16S rRNA (cytidine(1402)-2'-O)-methyltransferase [Candidatus Buchananbacteria bacterium]
MAILYVVATPIGNLEDITLRALETLKSVDLIVCEDTRVTKRLLDRYQINKPVLSYHQHSDLIKIQHIVDQLKNEKNVALVSDAGTPGISDPGNQLVAAAAQAEIKVVPIPGPSAVVSALSVAGVPTDNFIFYGFLPHKKGRQTIIGQIAENKMTSVFYESPHRILKALEQLKDVISDPGRQIIVCRELTKIYEEVVRGTIDEVFEYFNLKPIKGEFVVVVSGR